MNYKKFYDDDDWGDVPFGQVCQFVIFALALMIVVCVCVSVANDP